MAAPPHVPRPRLSREETVGLVVAALAHVGLIAWMALEPPGKPVTPPPERMTVTFADEVALESTSPEPFAEAAPELAPERGEVVIEPGPPELHEVIPPDPALDFAPVPPSRPAPAKPRPAAKAPPKPVARPSPKTAPKASPRPAPKDERARRRPDTPAGAGRIGSDFLAGVPGAQGGSSRNPPAVASGPRVAASLSQAITRELKPHWAAPQGAEADQLVTVLAWELNRDGSLAGRPRIVGQSGVTPANQAQKVRHAEQAIRAVQLAAPFNLPTEHYASWRRVSAFRFDRRLSQ